MSDINNLSFAGDVPVRVVGRKLACQNERFFVYLDHVVDHAGYEVKDFLVISPKVTHEDLITGVAILPFVGNSIGLIRIYRPALRDYSWEIPHGFVGKGEREEFSASRELMEETGLIAAPSGLRSLGYITPDSGLLAARVHLFIAKGCIQSDLSEKELGLCEHQLFSIGDFEKMIRNSQIQDTFTLAAWCRHCVDDEYAEPL